MGGAWGGEVQASLNSLGQVEEAQILFVFDRFHHLIILSLRVIYGI